MYIERESQNIERPLLPVPAFSTQELLPVCEQSVSCMQVSLLVCEWLVLLSLVLLFLRVSSSTIQFLDVLKLACWWHVEPQHYNSAEKLDAQAVSPGGLRANGKKCVFCEGCEQPVSWFWPWNHLESVTVHSCGPSVQLHATDGTKGYDRLPSPPPSLLYACSLDHCQGNISDSDSECNTCLTCVGLKWLSLLWMLCCVLSRLPAFLACSMQLCLVLLKGNFSWCMCTFRPWWLICANRSVSLWRLSGGYARTTSGMRLVRCSNMWQSQNLLHVSFAFYSNLVEVTLSETL